MTEKKSRGQPKFEPTQDQRNQVKLMKALGIPEDRICKTITNPRTRKPVAPMTLARAFAAELESGATEFHALVGNFILCAILGKKPMLGDPITWCAREVRTGLAVGGNRIRTCMGLFPIGRRVKTLRHLASFKPDSGRRRSISVRVIFAISPVADGNQCATFVADVRTRVSDK